MAAKLSELGLLVVRALVVVCSMVGGCAASRVEAYGGRPIPPNQQIDRLVVVKSKHLLEAWSGKRLLKVYTVAIGRGGRGPKRCQGDNKTPEGEYQVDGRFVSRKFHRFLHLSYPNQKDRKAFQEGRKNGSIPNHARIGGFIGIHGEKKGYEWLPHKWADWTQGCIAVDNHEVEELYRSVKQKARVIIYP